MNKCFIFCSPEGGLARGCEGALARLVRLAGPFRAWCRAAIKLMALTVTWAQRRNNRISSCPPPFGGSGWEPARAST